MCKFMKVILKIFSTCPLWRIYFAHLQSDLETEVHRLELENAKMEAALKHESSRVETLQKELADSSKVRTLGLFNLLLISCLSSVVILTAF